MRIDDVVVGEEYVYSTSRYGRPIRAKVIQVVDNIRYYNHRGLLVEFDDNSRKEIPARHLTRLWSEYEEQEAAKKKRMEEREKRTKESIAVANNISMLLDQLKIDADVGVGYTGKSIDIVFNDKENAIRFSQALAYIDYERFVRDHG